MNSRASAPPIDGGMYTPLQGRDAEDERRALRSHHVHAAASSPLAAPICPRLRSFLIWASSGWRRLSAPPVQATARRRELASRK